MKKAKTTFESMAEAKFRSGVNFRPASLVLLLGCFLLSAPVPAFADDDVLLKPDVPKMDKPIEAPSKTLKGTVQHSHKNPPRKPLTTGANQNGSAGLGIPGLGRLGRSAPLKSNARNNSLQSNLFAGIGIIGVKFEMFGNRPPIIKIVFSGTPASDEGIRPNDVIVAVDGVPTLGLSKEEVYDLIVGTPRTPVTLSLQRGDDVSVKRLHRMDFNDIPDPKVKEDYLRSM